MILIGEAGGTKIDWRLLTGDNVLSANTSGFNATLVEEISFLSELREHLDCSAVAAVHFYAAGIRTLNDKARIEEYFGRYFPGSQVEVASDTIAAARGLLGTSSGWVGFIGTGSGLAKYDGREITYQVPSLGYILGDEGSATYFGKELLRRYYRGQLGEVLVSAIQERLDRDPNPLMKVYQESHPQRFLGGLASILSPESASSEIQGFVRTGLEAYFDAFLPSGRQEMEIFFTGTVAHAHQRQLREVAATRGVRVREVVRSPIAGLVDYHRGG